MTDDDMIRSSFCMFASRGIMSYLRSFLSTDAEQPNINININYTLYKRQSDNLFTKSNYILTTRVNWL